MSQKLVACEVLFSAEPDWDFIANVTDFHLKVSGSDMCLICITSYPHLLFHPFM